MLIVAGNISLLLLTLGLFFATLRLGRPPTP
jgi:hypothetical protein